MINSRLRMTLFALLTIGLMSTSFLPGVLPGNTSGLVASFVPSQTTSTEIFHGGTVDTIRVIEYSTLGAALAAVDSGDADIFGLPIDPQNYSDVDSYTNLEKQWAFDTRVYMISINTRAYPLENVHLRKAIAYGVDKTDIAQNAMGGNVDVLDFAISLNNELTIEDEEGGLFYGTEVTNAVSELALAGMLDVDEDGVVEGPDGSEVVLTIWYPTDIQGLNETAALLSADLFSVGLNNTLVPMNYTQVQLEVNNHSLAYDIALYEVDLDRFGVGWAAQTFHHSNRFIEGENIANIDDETLNTLAIQYSETSSLDGSFDIGRNALRAVRDICPVIPLFGYRWLSVYNDANFDGWLDETNAGAYSAWNTITVEARAGADNELVVAVLPEYFESFFTSLNPFEANSTIDLDWVFKDQFNPYLLVYDSPIATLPDGSAVPREATSWEMQFLGTTSDLLLTQSRAQYYCDPNANWTDGNPLNAEDYRFTYEFYKNKSLTVYGDLIEEVKVTGSHVAGVTYNEREMFTYRNLGALPVLPKHVWNGTDPLNWTPSVQEAIGSGPFAFSAFVPNASLTLTRNTVYYPEVDDEAPTLRSLSMIPEEPIPAESVVIRVFVDDRSRIENVTLRYTYRVGQINFTEAQTMIEGALGYEGTIPARVTASVVDFEIEAVDIWGNSAIIATGSYTRETSNGDGDLSQSLLIVGAAGLLIIVVIAAILRRRKR